MWSNIGGSRWGPGSPLRKVQFEERSMARAKRVAILRGLENRCCLQVSNDSGMAGAGQQRVPQASEGGYFSSLGLWSSLSAPG